MNARGARRKGSEGALSEPASLSAEPLEGAEGGDVDCGSWAEVFWRFTLFLPVSVLRAADPASSPQPARDALRAREERGGCCAPGVTSTELSWGFAGAAGGGDRSFFRDGLPAEDGRNGTEPKAGT